MIFCLFGITKKIKRKENFFNFKTFNLTRIMLKIKGKLHTFLWSHYRERYNKIIWKYEKWRLRHFSMEKNFWANFSNFNSLIFFSHFPMKKFKEKNQLKKLFPYKRLISRKDFCLAFLRNRSYSFQIFAIKSSQK